MTVFNVPAALVAALSALVYALLSLVATDLVLTSPLGVASGAVLVVSLAAEAMRATPRLFWVPTWAWALLFGIYAVNAQFGRLGLVLAALGGGAAMVAGLVLAQYSRLGRIARLEVEALGTLETIRARAGLPAAWRAVDSGLRADWTGVLTPKRANLLAEALSFVAAHWPDGFDAAARDTVAEAAATLRDGTRHEAPGEPLVTARTVAEVAARRANTPPPAGLPDDAASVPA